MPGSYPRVTRLYGIIKKWHPVKKCMILKLLNPVNCDCFKVRFYVTIFFNTVLISTKYLIIRENENL